MAEQSAPSRSAIHTTGDEAPVLFRDPKQDQLSSSVWDVERGTWRGVDRKPPTRTCLGAAHGVGPGRARATQRGSWRVTPHPRVQEGRGQATSIPFRPSTTWLSGCSRGPWTLSQRRSSSAAVLGARTGVHQQRVLHPLLPGGLEQLVGARGGAAGGLTRGRTGSGWVDKRTVSADSKQHKYGPVPRTAGQSVGSFFCRGCLCSFKNRARALCRRGWPEISDGAR